jgi:hypothetical protein
MNAVDIYLWQFLWNRMQESGSLDQTLAAWRSWFSPFLLGVCVALLMGIIAFCLLALAYHPRIPRAGLWVPAYGLLGGAPKLHCHTRPPSFFGIFLKSRHRIRVVRKVHRKNAASRV